MSDERKLYSLDRHERAVTVRGLNEMKRIFEARGESAGVKQCDSAIEALNHPAPEPAAGERGWREFYDEVMRRAKSGEVASRGRKSSIVAAWALVDVAVEWGLEGESNE